MSSLVSLGETGTPSKSCTEPFLSNAMAIIGRIWLEFAPHIHSTAIKSVRPVTVPGMPWKTYEIELDHKKRDEGDTVFYELPWALGSYHVRRLANVDMCDTAARLFLPLIHDALGDYIDPGLTVLRDCLVLPKIQYLMPGDPHQVWHTVVRVVLLDGEQYIVDLTGCQFGLDDIICSWEDYQAKALQCEDAYRDREICGPNDYPPLIQDTLAFAADLITKDYFQWKDMVLKAGGELEEEVEELIYALQQRARGDIEDYMYRRRHERKVQGLEQ